MKPKLLLLVLLSLALAGCASTNTTPDAGPPGPPMPSQTAQVVAGFVSAGLGAAEPGFAWGVEYAADQGQTARCYWLLGLETLCKVGGQYAATVPATGQWLSKFDEIKVDPKRCNPMGTPPKVSPATAETIDKLGKALTGPIVALTRGVLAMAGVPCGWQAWAEGIEAELLALPGAILKALAGEPFVLPEVKLRECPAEAPPAPADAG